MSSSWVSTALGQLGSSALVSLIKLAVNEAFSRGIDLGPVGLSKSDFSEVDRRIDKSLEALRKAEDSAKADLLSHILVCKSCGQIYNKLAAAVEAGMEEQSEASMKALLGAHEDMQTWSVERFMTALLDKQGRRFTGELG